MTDRTQRLYWEDDHCFQTEARVVAVMGNELAFDRTCFYPGGGGQPPDEGTATFTCAGAGMEAAKEVFQITGVNMDGDSVIWHSVAPAPPERLSGQTALLSLDRDRRLAFARYHTVLHIVNILALRRYSAWITGAQIAADYARIDFKWEGFSSLAAADLEQEVNAVIAENRSLEAYYLSAAEFAERPDLLRTLEVQPPVIDGRVRVVAIHGFDAQACGGTHVGNTAELGRLSVYRTENKGRINKRLYVRLLPAWTAAEMTVRALKRL